LPDQPLFAIRYLRARARTQPVEKRIALPAAVSRGRIPRARFTRRGYLPSISSLGKKIVLRACFGSITARRNASEQLRDKNVVRMEFIDNGM